jgi:hypothetical protein
MTTLTLVHEYCGYLQEPIVAFSTDGLDMSAQTKHYWSSGPCDPIEFSGMGPRYRVETVEVPEWMTAVEYKRDGDRYERMWAYEFTRDLPETWQRTLVHMDAFYRETCIDLLKVKNFKSQFRASLRAQLEAWLSEETHKYQSPLSPRQFSALSAHNHRRY